jgi:hypothetical protein
MGRGGKSTDVIGRMDEWHVRRKWQALGKKKSIYETSNYDR